MVSDRAYVPEPVPSWTQIIADKDAEIARLNNIIQNMRYAEDEDKIRVFVEIERLRAALREIAAMDEVSIYDHIAGQGWLHQQVARAALEEEKKDE